MTGMLLFSNNAGSELAGNISPTAVTILLTTGGGAAFPQPDPIAGSYFKLSLTDATTQALEEICNCTNRVGDTLTVVRGQEGTTALSWSVNDIAENRWTAGSAQAMLQALSALDTAYAVDTGTANAITVAFPFAPGTLGALEGVLLTILKSNATNTTAVTITANGTAGTALVHADGTGIVPGELPANGLLTCLYTGTAYVLQSVATVPAVFSTIHDLSSGGRALNTPYTNTTGRPMFVGCVAQSTGAFGNLIMNIAGSVIDAFGQPDNGGVAGVTGIVPPGATYEVTTTVAGFTLSNWTETW